MEGRSRVHPCSSSPSPSSWTMPTQHPSFRTCSSHTKASPPRDKSAIQDIDILPNCVHFHRRHMEQPNIKKRLQYMTLFIPLIIMLFLVNSSAGDSPIETSSGDSASRRKLLQLLDDRSSSSTLTPLSPSSSSSSSTVVTLSSTSVPPPIAMWGNGLEYGHDLDYDFDDLDGVHVYGSTTPSVFPKMSTASTAYSEQLTRGRTLWPKTKQI